MLVAVFASILLFAVLPPASAPASRWGTPVLLENAPGSAELPQIAVDPSGNAVAVWDQFESGRKNVWANRFDIASGWGTPVLLETDNIGDATDAQIAVSASGHAVAVWNQVDAQFLSNIWANVYSPGTGWGTATLLETDNSDQAWEPQVAMDPNGNAIAVWYHWGAGVSNVWSNYYQVGVGWSPPMLVEFDAVGDSFEPQVGMDAAGNALAIWIHDSGVVYSLKSNRFVPGVGWGTPVLAEGDSTGNVVTPHLAVNPSGKAVAVWTWDDWSWMNVWANIYEPGVGWGTATLLETDDRGWAFDVEVAIDATGVAIAAWSQNTDMPQYNLFASRYTPGVGWGSPTLLENDDTWDALLPQVAFDASGAATVVWEQYVGGFWRNIYANRYEPGVGWEGAVLVALGTNGNAVDPQLAADPSGNVTAVWAQFDGGASSIWTNRYLSPSMGPLPPAAPQGVDATLIGGGQDVLLTWQASPDEGDASAFDHYEVLRGQAYDRGGTGYAVIAANLPAGTTSFVDAATVPGGSHYYLVRAVGPGGATSADTQAAKYVRALPAGRSLLGVPIAIPDRTVTAVLGSVLPVLDSVTAYDPFDFLDPWKTWVAAKSVKELTALPPSAGFWVTLSGPGEWRIAGGVPASTSVSLASGWNLVPYPSVIEHPLSIATAGLPVTRVEGLDAAAPPYYLQVLDGNSVLRAGEGYWVYALTAAVWSLPS